MSLRTIVTIVGLLVPTRVVFAQGIQSAYGLVAFSPPAGPLIIDPDQWDPIGSLDDLIKQSLVIVDGYVTTTFPAINTAPDHPGNFATAALVTIYSVLHGKISPGNQVLLVEEGGKQGKWDVSVRGNPLVKAGKHYIFFLKPCSCNIPDSEGQIPDTTVVSRF
jgi:hypothetical protein